MQDRFNHDQLQEYTLRNLCHYWPKMKEIGPYNKPMRFDVITIHRSQRQVRIFEIKANRNDFLGDNKWERYLDYCTHFAFVVPEGLVKKSELPDNVGLVYVKRTDQKYSWETPLKHEYIKGCPEIRPKVKQDNYILILEQVAARCADKID